MMALVHPLLMRSLAHFHNTLVTICDRAITYNDLHEEVITYVPNKDHTALRCHWQKNSGVENRTNVQTIVKGDYIVQLCGHYPTITLVQRAEIQNVLYNIVDIQHDDTNTLTYLGLELINAEDVH